jgi:hypothetical protein
MRPLAPTARRRTREAVLGIEPVLVVHCALLGVAQNIIGFLHVFKALLGGLVTGIEIGVVLARKFPIGFTDIVRGSLAVHPEGLVIIVLGRHKKKLGVKESGVRRARPFS